VICTGVAVKTFAAVMTNVLLVLPLGTVTVAGMLTRLGLLLDSDILSPPDPAAPLNVTVPVDCVPPDKAPITEAGERLNVTVGDGADTVAVAVPDTVPEIALIVAVPAVAPAEYSPAWVTVPTPVGTLQVNVGWVTIELPD
jgi:hypothetical protein